MVSWLAGLDRFRTFDWMSGLDGEALEMESGRFLQG